MIFSRVIGTGSIVPGAPVSNDDLVARGVETSDAWVSERTGIRFRHLADKGVSTSDLATEAARRALEAAGLRPADIDLVIVATTTPDMVFPSTACLVQSALGVPAGAPAFDVQAVCSGFVYALTIADKFLRSGSHKRALIIGAETLSRILDWSDRSTCVLFGDGAGAVVLEAGDTPGILASALHADGTQHGILSVPSHPEGGSLVGCPFIRMDGQAVFKFAVRVLADVAREVLEQAALPLEQLDWLLPHQANVRILQGTAKRLGLSEENVIVTVDRHGNTSAASVPLALDVAVREGRILPGQTVLLEGVGGGFTWGAVLLRI
ncbi:MAG: 3-oxoacyl-ACP synthase [Candidatus Dactylopiibacterium carminicum]|uniref:Beta-ketoacyl-[acyl-carrier-protein] synthase III n=1 Tax=Candidatus Dactylopiibacterium carminicum TaxID=857335 RepID=A0A272ESP4_9RHOO|nr:beta-ketoacyl-ACP synthase III [Candidatus Dactylopiibacterium carminicum]KAF7599098.1 ketoacyl-ACP synthase III [Candidatus Dactylopiibacterium carminicum]PAS93141.1 MAG: 3-oxoacyl-ACP synthase [Candidatus Dactylopiibacterium carminicum]PAS96887.1 MAG: 3-oxoacyl-ACP synthase [Candidatus Dactylopiibacterium carminicum]PAS99112.1 MAG: 3-oxoacyl-ACP synthase [Candidatus Dactylopiibacterium carminicum]